MINCFQCSYAEVRAEQRRELGIEESNPEVTADKVSALIKTLYKGHYACCFDCVLWLFVQNLNLALF